ncbi:hypothetical protein HDU96_003200 [Phlyctochytrium bullatum]|nr:hypothetical protein HDU96_003200 [Phlyctochytrium bullatum]
MSTDTRDHRTPSLQDLPTELLHRIVLRYLSPLDASRLMITSHAVRSVLWHLPLARQHLSSYILAHGLVASQDPPSEDEAVSQETEDDEDEADPVGDEERLPTSALPKLEGTHANWSCVAWDDGVDEIYWAALFEEFGYEGGMAVAAETFQRTWTEEQREHFSMLYDIFYRSLSLGMSCYMLFEQVHRHLRKLDPYPAACPNPFPPVNPHITSVLFYLVHIGLCPPPASLPSALAHVALFSPHALLDFLAALPDPPHKYLPTLLALLAYLNNSVLIAAVLTHYPPLPPPNGPGSLPHRVAAAMGNLSSLLVLLDLCPANLSDCDSEILRLTCRNGHTEVVKFLLDHCVAGNKAKENSLDALRTRSETWRPKPTPAGIDPGALRSEALCNAVEEGHTDIVRLLLDHSLAAAPLGVPCVDPSASDSQALRCACGRGAADIVKLLLDHSLSAAKLGIPCVNPSACSSQALRDTFAADMVKLLLDHSLAAAALGIPVVDPSAWDNYVLRRVSSENRPDIVKLLLEHSLAAAPLGIPTVDPSARNSEALRAAGESGYAEVVKLLLDHSLNAMPLGIPYVDPSVFDDELLETACRRGNTVVVKLLLDHAISATPLEIPAIDALAAVQGLRAASIGVFVDGGCYSEGYVDDEDSPVSETPARRASA